MRLVKHTLHLSIICLQELLEVNKLIIMLFVVIVTEKLNVSINLFGENSVLFKLAVSNITLHKVVF